MSKSINIKYPINSWVYVSTNLIKLPSGKTEEHIKWKKSNKDIPVHRKIKAKVISYHGSLGAVVLLSNNEKLGNSWIITNEIAETYNIPKEHVGKLASSLKDEFIVGKAFSEKKKQCKLCKAPFKKEFAYE